MFLMLREGGLITALAVTASALERKRLRLCDAQPPPLHTGTVSHSDGIVCPYSMQFAVGGVSRIG